jgi:hypothetical protein
MTQSGHRFGPLSKLSFLPLPSRPEPFGET